MCFIVIHVLISKSVDDVESDRWGSRVRCCLILATQSLPATSLCSGSCADLGCDSAPVHDHDLSGPFPHANRKVISAGAKIEHRNKLHTIATAAAAAISTPISLSGISVSIAAIVVAAIVVAAVPSRDL
eukprot:SAG31_NODE_2193_length_6224_cov_3.425469_3_plen_129_part_00